MSVFKSIPRMMEVFLTQEVGERRKGIFISKLTFKTIELDNRYIQFI